MRYNIQESITRQKKFAKEKGHPLFAPSDGNCWTCKDNIYSPIITEIDGDRIVRGCSVADANSQLITCCPHCNKSFVD